MNWRNKFRPTYELRARFRIFSSCVSSPVSEYHTATGKCCAGKASPPSPASIILAVVVANLTLDFPGVEYMRKFPKSLLMISLCILAVTSVHGEGEGGAPGIKALMTPQQYQSAGLHKPSEQERTALYQWMREYSGKTSAAQPGQVQPAAAAQPAVVAATSAVVPAPAVTASAPAAGAAVATAAVVSPAPAATAPATVSAVTPPEATVAVATPVPAAASVQEVEENFGRPEPRESSPEEAFKLYATVKQPFRGWNGKTVFYLDNGQIWKQRSHGRYTYMGDDSRVVISKNKMGFFEMRLIEADRSVGVKRAK